MSARASFQPEGRGINKVTVQLESRCIHSTAVCKADEDAADLQKRRGKKKKKLKREPKETQSHHRSRK